MRKVLLPAVVLLMLAAGFVTGAGMADVQAASVTYHGNRNSYIFHQPACRYFNCKNCTVVFSSRAEALQAGFRPCKICKP